MTLKTKLAKFKEEIAFQKQDILQKNQAIWESFIWPVQERSDKMIEDIFGKYGSWIIWGFLAILLLFLVLILGSITGGLTNMIGGAFP